MITQEIKILNYIRTNGSISQLEASDHLRITRLSARVFDMKAKGIPIEGSIVENVNRDGSVTRYKRYFIDQKWFDELPMGGVTGA